MLRKRSLRCFNKYLCGGLGLEDFDFDRDLERDLDRDLDRLLDLDLDRDELALRDRLPLLEYLLDLDLDRDLEKDLDLDLDLLLLLLWRWRRVDRDRDLDLDLEYDLLRLLSDLIFVFSLEFCLKGKRKRKLNNQTSFTALLRDTFTIYKTGIKN